MRERSSIHRSRMRHCAGYRTSDSEKQVTDNGNGNSRFRGCHLCGFSSIFVVFFYISPLFRLNSNQVTNEILSTLADAKSGRSRCWLRHLRCSHVGLYLFELRSTPYTNSLLLNNSDDDISLHYG